MSLLLLDIDHFKRLNDEHGHQAGDEVLRLVGATLKQVCREFDTPARYGGEEFAVILPPTGTRRRSKSRSGSAGRSPRCPPAWARRPAWA